MKNNKNSRVTIVGAGPGDPDLITVKGLKALQTADVVLYDALANPELLNHVPRSAKKIYVGKRAGNHRYSQEDINLLIVQSAFSFGHAVRLKGGDPMIFGRGHEEMEYIRSFDLPVDFVPGLSSCTSLAGLQGVPLTRRTISESFWVLTATTRRNQLSTDIEIAVKSTATLVILMGMRKIKTIMELLIKEGKSNTPVMVIQSGSLEEEKYVLGDVSDIVEKVEAQGVGSPGIIIIGEVVRLHPQAIYQEVLYQKKTA